MYSVEQAIILIAGRGHRLGNLTDARPKCLLEIGGKSFLERSLHALSKCGLSKAVLVVGYRKEQIQNVIGHRYEGIEIEYVINHRYAKTNTAYSLWLARDYLLSQSLILEGDIVFDEAILSYILSCSGGKSIWAAVPVTPLRNEGILLSRNGTGYVSRLKLVRHTQNESTDLKFKCAGIQLLTAGASQSLALKLDETIQKGEVRKYADLVLAEIFDKYPMILCSLDGMRWAEVDDLDDYESAHQMFSTTTSLHPIPSERIPARSLYE